MRTSSKSTSITRLRGSLVACAAAFASLGLHGCANESADETADGAEQLARSNSDADAAALSFVDVRANGTGCPAGTWRTEVAPDKKSFTVWLEDYEAEVSRDKSIDVKDCQLAIKVGGNASFAVKGFSQSGYAYLQRGVSARLTANYGFQGAPSPRNAALELKGPYSRGYVLRDRVDADEQVWSTCGVERDLNVTTRIRLTNGDSRAYGYVNARSARGELPGARKRDRYGIEFAVRSCGGEPDGSTPPDPVTDGGAPTDAEAPVDAETPPPDSGPNEDGLTITAVTANGTGCPAGTWTPELAPDGKNFKLRFSAYEAAVDSASSIAVKDCQLGIKVQSPEGVSYALSQFGYTGTATLGEGVTATATAAYYFQGNPVSAEPSTTLTLEGPYADTFRVEDNVDTANLLWSTCGVARDLNVVTRVRVRNGDPRNEGTANVTETLDVGFVTRPCTQ